MSSSSVMVVVTVFEPWPTLGAGPPPPAGLARIETVYVSPVPSSNVSSVVWTVKVWEPAAACVKVRVPVLAV